MADVVSVAIANGAVNSGTNEKTKWAVTFVTNDVLSGALQNLGSGVYVLYGKERSFYFPADKVVTVAIAKDQS